MPRYFFHLYNDEIVLDEEGQELAGADDARRVAVDNAREMAAASVQHGELNLEHRIDAADEVGNVIWTVRFGDIVKVKA